MNMLTTDVIQTAINSSDESNNQTIVVKPNGGARTTNPELKSESVRTQKDVDTNDTSSKSNTQVNPGCDV